MPESVPEKSIFSRVVRTEPALTSLLRNFLGMAPFRRVLLEGLLGLEGTAARLTVDCMHELPNGRGLPDLVLRSSGAEILIELKSLAAPLTERQPDGYLAHLQDSDARHRLLAFIVPSRYAHRAKLERRISQAMPTATAAGVQISLWSWSELIRLLDESDLVRVGSLFRHLKLLLEELFQRPPISFTSAEVTLMQRSEIPEIVINLFNLMEQTESEIAQSFTTATERKYDRGFYIDSECGSQIWFGVWWNIWKKNGWPLSIGVNVRSEDRIKERFARRHGTTEPFEEFLVAKFGADLDLRADPLTSVVEPLLEEVEYLLSESENRSAG